MNKYRRMSMELARLSGKMYEVRRDERDGRHVVRVKDKDEAHAFGVLLANASQIFADMAEPRDDA